MPNNSDSRSKQLLLVALFYALMSRSDTSLHWCTVDCRLVYGSAVVMSSIQTLESVISFLGSKQAVKTTEMSLLQNE